MFVMSTTNKMADVFFSLTAGSAADVVFGYESFAYGSIDPTTVYLPKGFSGPMRACYYDTRDSKFYIATNADYPNGFKSFDVLIDGVYIGRAALASARVCRFTGASNPFISGNTYEIDFINFE